jgi:Amt family ammonium transporter
MIVVFLSVATMFADDGTTSRQLPTPKISIDTIWAVLTAALMLFMNAGFAMLEKGSCRSKNAINILAN